MHLLLERRDECGGEESLRCGLPKVVRRAIRAGFEAAFCGPTSLKDIERDGLTHRKGWYGEQLANVFTSASGLPVLAFMQSVCRRRLGLTLVLWW